jgi:hypothetical protein
MRVLLQQGIDWTYLLRIASLHRLLPLLYWHLHRTSPDAVPQPVLDQLRRRFHGIGQRNLLLARELLRLLSAFTAHGIRAIPFKGPLLAATAYDNLALRQFRDLDILVQRPDILRAKDVLTSLGYQPMNPLAQAQGESYLQSRDYIFVRDDADIRVDLQWQITGTALAFPLDLEELQERLEPVSLAGIRVFHLPVEDLLLILAVHGCKHRWERLKWICDVAEVLRRQPEANWGQLLDRARRVGATRMLALGLFLVNDLLGAPLPEAVRRSIDADKAVKALARQVYERLFREVDDPPSPYDQAAFSLGLRERFGARMRYCLGYVGRFLRIALTPNAWDRTLVPLPSSLSPLYYLLRPIRLMRMYAFHPWKLKRALSEWFEHLV